MGPASVGAGFLAPPICVKFLSRNEGQNGCFFLQRYPVLTTEAKVQSATLLLI